MLRSLRPRKDGPISQGIAEWLQRQVEMHCLRRKSWRFDGTLSRGNHGARNSNSDRMLFSERDASGPRKGLQAPLIQSNLSAPSFSPKCGQRALNLKGGCNAY